MCRSVLDETAQVEAANAAAAVGAEVRASMEAPYRWRENPSAKRQEDTRGSADLIELMEVKGREVQELLTRLKAL